MRIRKTFSLKNFRAMVRPRSIYVAIALLIAATQQGVNSFALSLKSRPQCNIKLSSVVSHASGRFTTVMAAAAVPSGAKSICETFGLNYIKNLFRGQVVTNKIVAIGAVIVTALFAILRQVLWKPSRTYDRDANSVGREYDAWTTEGILEEYWGEHIHLGYYSPEELKAGYKKKNFIQAKYDFVDQMMDFGKAGSLAQPMTVLDVGCGIGGT